MFELNRDRVATLMSNIEKMLMELAKVTAKEFNENDIRYMYIALKVEGRTDGDVTINFTVGESEYNKESVTGHRLMEVYQEYARRKGWEKTNSPLMLSFDTSGRVKEEDHGTYVLELPSRSDPLSEPHDYTKDPNLHGYEDN